ncbi:hypothetical protein J3459_006053 [Metarhizium acridum]|nr:hypothetical protein J3459_006053 [Metarhizium acridum]
MAPRKLDQFETAHPLGTARGEGIIKNVNTLEQFKTTDKTEMIKKLGDRHVDTGATVYLSTASLTKIDLGRN